MILALRTDQLESAISLYKESHLLDQFSWQAGRELSNTLLLNIDKILIKNELRLNDLKAIIVFQGPGSFTGLRIGITVANTLAYSLDIPVVAGEGDNWASSAISKIRSEEYTLGVSPVYGAPANITKQKK